MSVSLRDGRVRRAGRVVHRGANCAMSSMAGGRGWRFGGQVDEVEPGDVEPLARELAREPAAATTPPHAAAEWWRLQSPCGRADDREQAELAASCARSSRARRKVDESRRQVQHGTRLNKNGREGDRGRRAARRSSPPSGWPTAAAEEKAMTRRGRPQRKAGSTPCRAWSGRLPPRPEDKVTGSTPSSRRRERANAELHPVPRHVIGSGELPAPPPLPQSHPSPRRRRRAEIISSP